MDPYLVLKVRRDCTRAEVQETFREKARLAHPDHGGDEKQFIKVCTAYKMILSDLEALAGEDPLSSANEDAKRRDATDLRPGEDPYLKLFRRVSARADAGKSRRTSGRSRSVDDDVDPPATKSALLGGVVAVVLFLVCVVASVMDPKDKSMAPAALNPADENADPRVPGTGSRVQSRDDSWKDHIQSSFPGDAEFSNLPRLPGSGLP